jgi:acetyltransferase-like isoleucine patch superfamily enzyme
MKNIFINTDAKCNLSRNNFFINPKRVYGRVSLCNRLIYFIKFPFLKFGTWLGFTNIEYAFISGDKKRLKIGNNCSTTNTLFNVASGNIIIKDNTIFSHNCMLLTGTHRFYNGKRASLSKNHDFKEVPDSGRDIIIGSGCYIGSGAIFIGPVEIGDNVIIGAGSVVTKNIENSCFAAGSPAKIISKHA